MSYFSDLYTAIKYPIASEHSTGLRNAQLGAIHAIGCIPLVKVLPCGRNSTKKGLWLSAGATLGI